MSRILKNHRDRVATIEECLDASDDCANKGDWYGCGAWASEARDMACVGRMLATDLANVIGERNSEAAAVWVGYADHYGRLESGASAVVADCETYLG